MGHKRCLAKLFFYFGVLNSFPSLASTVDVTIGATVDITCSLSESLPQWTFGVKTITILNLATINTDFSRIKYATNQKDLILTDAQLNDTGDYVCTHSSGSKTVSLTVKPAPTTTTSSTTTSSTTTSPTTSPTTTSTASTTTSPTTTSSTTTSTASTASTTTTSPQAPPANSPNTPRSTEEKGFTKTIMIIVIICSCAAAAIVVFIVLLVIRHWKHQKEKSPNGMVDFEGQNVNSRNEFVAIPDINMETHNIAE